MKLLLLLLRSLLLTIFIVLLTTCNASESDTNIPKNSESVQIPEDEKAVQIAEDEKAVQIAEDENWKIFEDNRSGITFSYPSIWKTLDEENTIVLEGPFGHIIFQDISVPADELDQVAKDMFDMDDNYVEVSRTQYSNPDRYMSIGSFKDGPSENIVRFLVAYPEYGLTYWEMIVSDQESIDTELRILEKIISSVRLTNVQNQDTVNLANPDEKSDVTDEQDAISVTDSNSSGKVTWNTPNLNVLSEHPQISCLNDVFSVFIDVFGVYVVAPSSAPLELVIHTANVLAEYIDNDEDGIPDDQAVLNQLIDGKFVAPVWTKSVRDAFWPSVQGTYCEDNIRTAASMYYDGGDEWALGGIQSAGTWDTNLEEMWHIVTGGGWAVEYPDYFSLYESSNSLISQAMDMARGGRFLSVPEQYPDSAWYRNYEGAYPNQVNEYFYWIMMANFGALDPSITDKCQGSSDEWGVCTKEQLAQVDPLAHSLLNDHGFNLPDRIPDGNYSPKEINVQDEVAAVTPVAAHDQATAGPQNIPVYDPTFCPGADVAGHLVQMNEPLIDCLIEANKSDTPPVVVAGAAMDPAAVTQVHEALDAGIEILGGWGPLYVVMVGVNDPDSIMLAEHLCGVYDKNGLHVRGGSLETCITETADEFSRYDCCGAVHNPPETLSPVGLQSIQFSGPEISAAEGRLRITTLHEYVHVFQNAQTVWPNELDSDMDERIPVYGHGMVWVEEGSAEFLAQYFAGQRGWTDYRANMKENLLSAREVRANWGLSLRDVETRAGQARVRELCDCGGMLYYETGTWATAWLVNRAGIDAFLVDYFPRLSYDGWEVTFQNAFGLTMDEFYDEFDAFLDQSIELQMAILP